MNFATEKQLPRPEILPSHYSMKRAKLRWSFFPPPDKHLNSSIPPWRIDLTEVATFDARAYHGVVSYEIEFELNNSFWPPLLKDEKKLLEAANTFWESVLTLLEKLSISHDVHSFPEIRMEKVRFIQILIN